MLNNQILYQSQSFDEFSSDLYFQSSANALDQHMVNRPYSLRFSTLRHTGK